MFNELNAGIEVDFFIPEPDEGKSTCGGVFHCPNMARRFILLHALVRLSPVAIPVPAEASSSPRLVAAAAGLRSRAGPQIRNFRP